MDRSVRQTFSSFISYIHHTSGYRQYCPVGNTAQHCRLGLFQDPDFAGDLEDSNFNLGRKLMYLWKSNIRPHLLDVQETNVSISQFYSIRNNFVGCWFKDVRATSGLRIDGLLALYLWDVVLKVLRSSNSTKTPTNPVAGNSSRNQKSKPKQKGSRHVDHLSHVDYVTTGSLGCTSLKTMKQ